MTIATTEPEAVYAWGELLSQHFDIDHEVAGTHYTGRKVRMDMMLYPRFYWRGGGDQPIGFEIKRPGANQAEMIGQAADYAASQFEVRDDGGAYDPHVFVAVYAPSFRTHQCNRGVFLSEQMMGRLGVIMFDVDENLGLHLRVSGNAAWTAKRGCMNMNWSAKRKFGSR